jgi:tRNA A-37 threonylcarbamoyl transferase component Bud32
MKVTAGENYSNILTKEGLVYSFGLNDIGQLGLGITSSQTNTISQVNFERRTTNIFSNRFHSYLLTNNQYKCNGLPQFDRKVCSENGICLNNKCHCKFGYLEENFCLFTKCFDILSNETDACTSNGKCIDFNNCECKNGYTGFNCGEYKCDGIDSKDLKVCSGRGECDKPENCICSSLLYSGEFCENPAGLNILIIGSFLLLLLISIGIVIFLILIIIILWATRERKNYLKINSELIQKLMVMSDLNKIEFKYVKFEYKYNKKEVLGKGASSIVYKGKYKENYVAIKEVYVSKFDNNIIAEILILKNIKNKNIVKYYGYTYDSPGNLYILTEFAMHGCLNEFLETKPSINQRIKILIGKKLLNQDICKGMDYLHSLSTPIIHGDLKTENILIFDNYKAKISDFGISKYFYPDIKTTVNFNKGNSTLKIGTPIYQSPEQFQYPFESKKPKICKGSDVYCFGSIIYEILFQILPWSLEEIESLDELFQLVVIEKKRPKILYDKFNDNISKSLISVLKKCWNPNFEKRPSFNQILNYLCSIE